MKSDTPTNWNESRLSRRPFTGKRYKLAAFNAEQAEKGRPRLWATKGWEKLPAPVAVSHVAGEVTETLAQRMLYGFMGYWR